MNPNFLSNRRRFLTGAALTAGMYGLNLAAQAAETKTEKDSGLFVIGPKPPKKFTRGELGDRVGPGCRSGRGATTRRTAVASSDN